MPGDPLATEWQDVVDLNEHLLPIARVNDICRAHEIPYESTEPTTFSKYLAMMERMSEGGLAGRSLLDFGCGLCVMLAQAHRLGMKPVGVDQFGEYRGRGYEAAKAILVDHGASPDEANEIARYGDVLDPDPAFRGAFDFSISVGMLEHIAGRENRRKIVLGLYDALKPGGSLFMLCGPNIRFPFDLGHYGPRYVFLHCLPRPLRAVYLKLFARSLFQDPDYLQGMSVNELTRFVREVDPEVRIRNGFPTVVKLMSSRESLKRPPLSWLVRAATRVLVALKAEPFIFLIFTKPDAKPEEAVERAA